MNIKAKYEPKSYWQKRLSEDFSLTGVGHKGFGLEYNIWLYKARLRTISQLIKEKNINCKGIKLLDIGVGTGFYINFWEKLGVNDITGFDITTKAIEELNKKYPNYKFIKRDISDTEQNIPDEKYDIITAFDILYHIVKNKDFESALENIRKFSHKDTVILIMDSFLRRNIPTRFHENDRTLDYYKQVLNSRLLDIVEIKPIFYFMNAPIDIERLNNEFSKFLTKRMWWLNLKINSFCKRIGRCGKPISYLWAFSLYCLDSIILKCISLEPSTKLLFAKPKSGIK